MISAGCRRSRVVIGATLALASSLAAVTGGFAQAAVWTLDDIRFSEASVLSLTATSGQSAGMLPDGSIYGVWYERTGNRSSVVRGAARALDGTWLEREFRISLGDSLSRNPTLAISPAGDVHVVWEDLRHGAGEEIYYRHRSPSGVWDPEERVTNSEFPSVSPVVGVAPGGRMHVVWSDGVSGNFEIYHRYRDLDGSWSPVQRVTTNPGKSLTPVLAVATDGFVHVVWQDNVLDPTPSDDPNNTEIYYLELDPDGNPTGPPERVSDALGSSRTPAVALAPDGSLHIFWSDNRDRSPSTNTYFPFAIWYRRRLPDLGFGHEKRFVYSASDHLYPSASVSPEGVVNAVWEDFAHGNSEIYFRQIRPDTGWEPAIRLTQTVGPTRNPTIVADALDNLHLIWSDTSPGEEASIRYRLGRVSASTPVTLARVAAAWVGDDLRLSWDTTSEIDHAGFVIQGSAELSEEPESLVLSPIRGGPHYEVSLSRDVVGERRFLKLVAISRDGNLETAAVIPVPRDGVTPPVAGLLAPHPNPSRGTFTIPVVTNRAAAAALDLVDVTGRRVATLDLGSLSPGTTAVSWSPLVSAAGPAAGRYWVRLILDGRSAGDAAGVVLVK